MNAYTNYLEGRVLAADPIELVRILYEEALGSIGKAADALRDGRIQNRSQAITRAQSILIELTSSLDMERGGDIARTLGELYPYLIGRLSEAHLQQKAAPLEETARLLTTLLEGWQSCQVATTTAPTHSEIYRDDPLPKGSYSMLPEVQPELATAGRSWTY